MKGFILRFFEKSFGQKVVSSDDLAVSEDQNSILSMENQGLITTLEREFSVPIFKEFGEWIVQRDEVYEIFSEGLGDQHPTFELLSQIGDVEIEHIKNYAQKFCEDDRITSSHVRNAIKETLWHWKKETQDA